MRKSLILLILLSFSIATAQKKQKNHILSGRSQQQNFR